MKRISNKKLLLSEWLGLKYSAWLGVNVWFWFKDASLTEVFLINGLILIVATATKIHATAIGIMLAWQSEPTNDNTHQKFVIFPPTNKQDIN